MSETILIIDKLQVHRLTLRQYFNGRYKLIEASDIDMGLTYFETEGCPIDLLLIGWEALKEDKNGKFKQKYISEKRWWLPLIVIGTNEMPDEAEILKIGATDCLRWSFDPELILRRVNNAITGGERRRYMKEACELKQLDPVVGYYNQEGFTVTATEKMVQNPEMNWHLVVCRLKIKANDPLIREHCYRIMGNLLAYCFGFQAVIGRIEEAVFGIFLQASKEYLSCVTKSIMENFEKEPPLAYPIPMAVKVTFASTEGKALTLEALCEKAFID